MLDTLKVTNRFTPQNRLPLKKSQDNESNIQAENGEENNNNSARSRGLQYVQDLQNGKTPSNPQPINNQPAYNNSISQNRTYNNGVYINYPNKINIHKQNVQPKNNITPATNVNNTEEPLSKRISPRINIAQIVGDFKNTAHAIGTPEDIYDEVNTYLELVKKQTTKDNANVKLVQTNIRSAASLLDEYISNTLNKVSKVVENWVEAIFLQQVDYKYNTEDINEAFLVQVPENNENKNEIQQSKKQKPQMDLQLKNLFHAGLNSINNGDFKTGLLNLTQAEERAKEINDTVTLSKILFEKGQLFDKIDALPQALTEYNNAINSTNDNNIKIKSHYSMAQIYNDVNEFKPAIEHYMAAIAFAGEKDNFKAQIQSLTKIGDIYSDKYDKEAFNIYEHAQIIAEESKDNKNKGYVSNTIANAYDKFNRPNKALKYYSDAVKNYEKAGADTKVAQTYQRAGELMIDYKKYDKGRNLIEKAIQYAKKAHNNNLIEKLEAEMQFS